MSRIADFAKLYDRPIPHSPESEMQVLGAMLVFPKLIPDIMGLLNPEDFYIERHATIYRAVVACYNADAEYEPTAVVNTLRDSGAGSLTGGEEYIRAVMEGCASEAGTEVAARTVADYSKLRRLMNTADRIMQRVKEHGPVALGSVREILDEAESAVFAVAQETRDSRESSTMNELMQAQLEQMRANAGEQRGVPTGILDLDKLTLGLHAGDMAVLAARPSMGKTALAGLVALNAAEVGVPVAFFSLEMNRNTVAQRWLAAVARVDSHAMRTGHVGEDAMRRITEAVAEMQKYAEIVVDDSASLTVMALRARARRMVARKKVGLIVVDYLQLLTAPEQAGENRQLEVAAISRGLKALARETQVPVLVLSQLNRLSEGRTGNRPRMSDLRDSGAIEQDADVVLLLHREDYYHDDEAWRIANPDKVNVAELIVAKQRNGPVGSVKLTWVPSLVLFRNWIGPSQSPFGEPRQPEIPF